MTVKFLEVLLAAAVALSVTDWGFKDIHDTTSINTQFRPDELINDQQDTTNNYGASSSGQDSSAYTFTKEEHNILNAIINFEESQIPAARFLPNTNLLAYPLFSQESDESNYSDDIFNRNAALQQTHNTQDGGSPSAGRASSWPPSPPSPIDDGELFGAVGYAPLSDNQYFDIESFLNADFPSDIATDNAISSLFASPSVTRQSSINSEHAETIDQLAQFLGSAIESPSSPEFIPKSGPKFPAQFLPSLGENAEVEEATGDVGGDPSISFSKEVPQSLDGPSRINEIEKLLKSDYLETLTTKTKGKENPIAGIQSYDYVERPSVIVKKRVKNEPVSPSTESDFSTLSHSSDFEGNGYASSSSSSFDSSQNGEGKREKLARTQNKRIWLDLPYTKDDIINTKIEDFNNIIIQLDPLRQHVAKEIRRKGKNKLAARNCRKRKIDAIDTLGDGVNELERQKQLLLDERLQLELERDEIVRKTEFLYEHIFKNLRDERGIPYSKENFSLTYTADGAVYLVPNKNQDTEKIGSR